MKEETHKWISIAEADLELARKGKVSRKIPFSLLCFHAQQAVEKALKAVLIFYEKEYPRTHNIQVLINLIQEEGVGVPRIIFRSAELTKYASTRYPDENDEIDKEEYKYSVKIAQGVFKWAKSITSKKHGKLF